MREMLGRKWDRNRLIKLNRRFQRIMSGLIFGSVKVEIQRYCRLILHSR